MLRSLGITTLLKWFLVACVLLAIWQGYNGNIGAIVQAVWGWIQTGADVVTRLWNEVNSGSGKG